MTELDFFSEISRVTAELYKPNAGAQERLQSKDKPGLLSDEQVGTLDAVHPAAPLTFADIPLGESFEDEHGLTWEKRSEKHAISWDWMQWDAQYGPMLERQDFKPTDIVRAKP